MIRDRSGPPGGATRNPFAWAGAGSAALTGLVRWAAALVGLARWARRRPRCTLAGLAVGAYGLALALAIQQQVARETARGQGLECLALNIYHEARGEPEEGKLAVGQVVLNRVADPHFPNAICDVIKEGGERPFGACQFSWWCDGRSDRPADQPAWQESMATARRILSGSLKDLTGGALWYHTVDVRPPWRFKRAESAKIGRHVFYARPGAGSRSRAPEHPAGPGPEGATPQ